MREEGLISGKFLFDESMVLYSKIRPYLMKVARPDFNGLCSADMYPLTPLPNEITRDDLWNACSHVSQVERDFNVREGLTPEEDTLPARFTDHPLPDGPSKGTTINIKKLVKDYYVEKGWDD